MSTELKRDEIKYIRDLAKSSYKKDTECRICGTQENLQFHHYYSLTALWNKFKKKAKIKIHTVQDILDYREQFKASHHKEIYEDTVTLCKFHHMDRLHKIYGKSPSLATAEKQRRWVELQREKERNK
jgi:hypothetical protein